MKPTVIGIGGFASNVGKTGLLCELLRRLPGWEAIKTTRGHYRSCGKDPQRCCVSHLLADEPSVLSGRELNYDAGKDTARYWDAGAANVHWVIATDNQVERGVKQALELVRAPGVLVEGNSFAQFVNPHYFLLVASPEVASVKASARVALSKASAIYVAREAEASQVRALLGKLSSETALEGVSFYHESDIPFLAELFRGEGNHLRELGSLTLVP